MELSIKYFKDLLNTSVEDLDTLCESWGNLQKEVAVPDDVLDEIRTVIGLSKLLKDQKLKQFGGLVKDSEFKTGEKEITLVDLQGFWEMVYHEVEKIQKSFKNLQDCKDNNWIFVENNIEKVPKKKVPSVAPAKKVDSSNTHAQAAKQRLAEIKKKMMAQRKQQEEQNSSETPEVTHVLKSNRVVDQENSGVDHSEEIVPSPRKIAKSKPTPNKISNKPSPSKIAKSKQTPSKIAENMTSPDKISKNKQTPSKKTKNKPVQKKSLVSSLDKENTPTANIQVINKRSIPKSKQYEEFEKRITRSAKKAMLAQQEAAQGS